MRDRRGVQGKTNVSTEGKEEDKLCYLARHAARVCEGASRVEPERALAWKKDREWRYVLQGMFDFSWHMF